MRKTGTRWIVPSLALFVGGLKSPLALAESPAQLARANNQFAFDLYSKLRASGGNVVVSPYSISTALMMVQAGAKGATATQMSQVLHFPEGASWLAAFHDLRASLDRSANDSGIELSISNSLWVHQQASLVREYERETKSFFKAQLCNIDFTKPGPAAAEINALVNKQTSGNIKKLIDDKSLSNQTVLVAVNTVHFKGKWQSEFRRSRTRPEPFFSAPGSTVQAATMTTEGSYRYSERPDFQMLELPYLKSAFSMLVLLPTTKDGVRNLEASLSDGTLSEWIKELKQTEARVFLPRFELDTRYDLVDSLRSLGIEDAFSEARADFTRMSKEPGIYLSAVVTAARILVNEEGTEASAATGGVMTKAAKPLPAIVFRADHPFLFILRHNKTGEVLFLGRLENP